MRHARATFVVLAGLATLMAWARPLHAQELEVARARQGYYVAFGLGPELEAASDRGKSRSLSGGGGSLRLGQMLSPRFGLGIRIDSGSAEGDGFSAGAGGLSLEGQMNLWRELSLHAGLGLGFVQLIDNDSPDQSSSGGYGALVSLAVSYDWFFTHRITGGWAVSPMLMVRGLPGGGDVEAAWFGLGVQISWWSGRPRQELVLPENEAYK